MKYCITPNKAAMSYGWKFLYFLPMVLLAPLFLLLARSSRFRAAPTATPATTVVDDVFPTFDITFEMATLSSTIYAFHKEDYGNDMDEATKKVCGRVNAGNVTERPVPPGVHCHWYFHDWIGGAQVMIVSSESKQYIAVVFAGTDDLRTSLVDVDLFTTYFGASDDNNTYQYPVYNVSLRDPNVRVHAGFNHAVFDRNLFGGILMRVEAIRKQRPTFRVLATGHSLGAANSVILAVGMTQYYEQERQKKSHFWNKLWPKKRTIPEHMDCISFGCPMIGNTQWRDFLHNDPVLSKRLTFWRHVLGRDLVPRLPQLYYHEGHTVQWLQQNGNGTASAKAYFHHYGNATLSLAGVPFGWSAKPYMWVPGALHSHMVHSYWEFLVDWKGSGGDGGGVLPWVNEFVPASEEPDDDDHPPNVDDDFYVDPPDDDAFQQSPTLRGRGGCMKLEGETAAIGRHG